MHEISFLPFLFWLILSTFSFEDYSQKILSESETGELYFGHAVAIENQWALVGATDCVYFFQQNNQTGKWEQHSKFNLLDVTSSVDKYELSVSISGNYAIVGDYQEKSVYVYQFLEEQNQWKRSTQLTNSSIIGYGFATSIHENYIIVGAHGDETTAGNAYIYKRDNLENWNLIKVFVPEDSELDDTCGYGVSITNDHAAISCFKKSVFYVVDSDGDAWNKQTKLQAQETLSTDYFGCSISMFETQIVVGACMKTTSNAGDGAAYLFELNQNNNQWEEKKKFVATKGSLYIMFGYSVSVDKNYISVGTNEVLGELYAQETIYFFSTEDYSLLKSFDTTEIGDFFGQSINTNGYQVIAGAYRNDEKATSNGAAFVYAICPSLECQNEGIAKYDCQSCYCPGSWDSKTNCSTCSLSCPENQYPHPDCNSCLNSCFNVLSNEESVCSGNGLCLDFNFCKCSGNFTGEKCTNCTINHGGEDCDQWLCSSFPTEADNFYYEDNCVLKCKTGYVFSADRTYCITESAGVNGSIFVVFGIIFMVFICIVIFVVLVLIVLIFTLSKKANRFNHIKDLDLVIKEAELEQQNETPNKPKFKVSKSSYLIDFKEIEILTEIGSGGSSSTIYKCKWKGMECAYKGFRLTKTSGTSIDFEEFEKEVQVCANVNHPSILAFYGAVVSEARVGLLLEFCSKGDIPTYLGKYKANNKGKTLEISKKLLMVEEIVAGMEYLHSRSFIHRDLKPENILIDNNEKSKIIDFGLSKKLQSSVDGSENNEQTMTRQIGTLFYMAPEVITGHQYSYGADVYSWAILVYSLITENFFPFGTGMNNSNLMNKVSSDKNFRPSIDEKQFAECSFIVPIIQKNWNHDPEKRNTFAEIVKSLKEKKVIESTKKETPN